MGKPYQITAFAKHMNEFGGDERGPILDKIGTRRNYRFRFRNPLLPPYIIMSGISQGLIDADDAARIQNGPVRRETSTTEQRGRAGSVAVLSALSQCWEYRYESLL